MNNNEILETIDCTPTWEALLTSMLTATCRLSNKRTLHADEFESQRFLISEFKKMAQAADKWNAHCKALI